MNIQSIGTIQPTTSKPVGGDLPAIPRQADSANSVAQDQEKLKTPAAENPDELQASIQAVNDFVQRINNSLQFSVDKDTGKTIVKVVDISTQEVIKQIPSEEMVAIAKALDQLKGLLIQQKA